MTLPDKPKRRRRTKEEIEAARRIEDAELFARFGRMTADKLRQMSSEGVKRVEVMTSGDARVCADCKRRAGVYKLAECPRPPFHPADEERQVCRCIVLAAQR